MRVSPRVRVATVTTRTLLLLRAPYGARFPSKFRLAFIHVYCTELCRFLALASSLPLASVLHLVSASALRRLSSLLCVVSAFCSAYVSASSRIHVRLVCASPLPLACHARLQHLYRNDEARGQVPGTARNEARTKNAINKSRASGYIRAPEGVAP